MASVSSELSLSKLNSKSDWRGKVRIVGKIRASTDLEINASNGDASPWISVQRSKEGEFLECATVSFGDQLISQKDSYKLDYCYEQGEEAAQIFSREVKPLLSGVFDGLSVSVLAYGARGSGKTFLMQGTEGKPGLAPLALGEILSIGEGINSSVTVSFYEVHQDHIYDLLEHNRPEVSILEDSLGRIQLKGLSQVPVKTLAEFYEVNGQGSTSHNPAHKAKTDVSHRSHKGLIIYVSQDNKDSSVSTSGKINFVDLAGYVDTKRKSIDVSNLVETTWINKSLYTLQNVVKALNGRERVPYRESKLTRMLQESFEGKCQSLMVTCLNPSFCQDTIYTVSLASRSCQAANQVSCDSIKKTKSTSRIVPLPSPKVGRRQAFSNSVKKYDGSLLRTTEMRIRSKVSTTKGRKLFDGANSAANSIQEKVLNEATPTIEPSSPNDTVEKDLIETNPMIQPSSLNDTMESSLSSVTFDMEHSQTVKEIPEAVIVEETKPNLSPPAMQLSPRINIKTTCNTKSLEESREDCNLEKENNILVDMNGSPPLSERLRELSNSLKSLCSKTPLACEKYQEEDEANAIQDCKNLMDPKTPNAESCKLLKNRDIASSPWEASNVMDSRQSLVQQYLNCLNSASKEELKELKGIGEKRATYILELREESPEPFKNLDDLKTIGLSEKQIKGMMRKYAGDLF